MNLSVGLTGIVLQSLHVFLRHVKILASSTTLALALSNVLSQTLHHPLEVLLVFVPLELWQDMVELAPKVYYTLKQPARFYKILFSIS